MPISKNTVTQNINKIMDIINDSNIEEVHKQEIRVYLSEIKYICYDYEKHIEYLLDIVYLDD